MTAVWIVLALAVILAAAFVFILRTLARGSDRRSLSAEWLDEFSIDSYAPMERLLDTGDVAFLASQPGYRPEIGKRLMRERRKIFRNYLQNLSRDFNRLIALGKLMVVYSSEDRPEFANTLVRQQLRFHLSVCAVRLQLALHPLGWTLSDVRGLVQSVEAMRHQVQQLALQRAALGELA